MKVKMTTRIKQGEQVFESGETYSIKDSLAEKWISQGYCEKFVAKKEVKKQTIMESDSEKTE